MDNPATESLGNDLNPEQAASLFAAALDAPLEEEKQAAEAEPAQAETPVEEAPATDDPESKAFTVTIDGKEVTLTEAQIAEAYKNGLRQSDYTKKTMEVSEQRKATEAEQARIREERSQLQDKLSKAAAVLDAGLQEQSRIDWNQLLQSDPVEFLKQQHIANQRQAQLRQIQQAQAEIHQRNQAEQAAQMRAFLQTQQQELLAKLPEWKDAEKAQTERGAIRDYLKAQGFDDSAIENINDHRAVVLSRKAMLYDQMMGKAQAAAKKVSNLPTKVERPGVTEGPQGLDKRTSAYQRLSKSGRVEDAAAVFASIL